jgi:hypothetical protein
MLRATTAENGSYDTEQYRMSPEALENSTGLQSEETQMTTNS